MSAYKPQLATLAEKPPTGPGWVHEIKYDGYRMGAIRRGGSVYLESRNEVRWTAKLPEVEEAVRRLPCSSAVIDGEVAIVLPDGRTSFQRLQNIFGQGGARAGLVYFVFDLLELDGEPLEKLPLLERKARLQKLVAAGPELIRYAQHIEGDGAAVLAQVDKLGMEGIISKRANAPHRAGRSDGWLKAKCTQFADLVVGGFSDPSGARNGLGALLVGVYDDHGELQFAGGVGTGRGWTGPFLSELRRGLEGLEQAECPFAELPPPEYLKGAHWVRPALVVEVGFAEWTDEGTLRHPSFRSFQPGKDPRTTRRRE